MPVVFNVFDILTIWEAVVFRKLILAAGSLFVLVILCVAAAYYYLVKLPLPQTEGELRAPGLHAAVTVYRDRWGTPHLYASDEHDLFWAQGFVQAQDRLWQMEANRRLAAGRLSEIIGDKALPMDRLMRTFGVMRAARRELAAYNDVDRNTLDAFADGVNAYIQSRSGRLPLEFRLLGFKPEPWLPEHSIGWGKVMALFGSKNWEEEIVRAMLIQSLGEERAIGLLGHNRPFTPTVIPSALNLAAWWPSPEAVDAPFVPVFAGGSNNWVVDGAKTETGYPLLANDMHLAVGVPSVWYEMHLVGGAFDIIGLSLPGVPMVIAGHNQEIAWGITFAYTDVQDVFLERMNPNRRGEYAYLDQCRQADLIREEIRVKGLPEAVIHEVWETRHGPIITPAVRAAKLGYALAFKWSAMDPGDMLPVLRRLNLARNWSEFKAAGQDWPEPPMNLVYADRQGNIGYVLAGRVPLRKGPHGVGPFPGWTGHHEWMGYLPPDQKPILFNPPQGMVATANNQVVADGFPHYLGADYASGFRAARILEVLSREARQSVANFRTLQGDVKCLSAARFIQALNGVEGGTPETRNLLERLRAWDLMLSPESVGGAIYAVLYYRLLENTFRDDMGAVTDRFLGVGLTPVLPLSRFVEHSRVILQDLMADPQSAWFDDATTPDRENLSDVVEQSLRETYAYFSEKLGPDPDEWRWGRIHAVEINHPLGRVKPLDRLLNLGPFEGGGHFDTVWQSALKPGMDFRMFGWTVSNRHIYDLQDWDRSLGAIVPGQSGMYGSPHYGDQVRPWLQAEHHPLVYSRRAVETEARQVLRLRP